jgi:hypothetical protein
MKKIEKLYFLVAVVAAVAAIILMLNGSVFGESTVGYATVLNIIAVTFFAKRRRLQTEDAIQRVAN